MVRMVNIGENLESNLGMLESSLDWWVNSLVRLVNSLGMLDCT